MCERSVYMKTAEELFEISNKTVPEKVAQILDGVREHIIARCEEEANNGATYYEIQLKSCVHYLKDLLLEECIKLVKEFEDNGYKIVIKDKGNGYYLNFSIIISWNGKEKNDNGFVLAQGKILYTTEKGVIK